MRTRSRGGGWVLVQLVIFALILWEPLHWTLPLPTPVRWLGLLFIVAGGWLGTGGLLALGPSLSVFPEPRDDARLVARGVYARVRHPIYGGLVLGSLGLSLWRGSLSGLLLAALLFAFFDRKSRYEEGRLETRFPTYAAYRRQVGKRLVPWIY